MSPDAQVDLVPPDFAAADRGIAQARNHHHSAELEGIDKESAYILLYSATHKAATAVLGALGRRVSAGERGHVVLLKEVRHALGTEHAELMSRLDRARQQRNRVAYETLNVGQAELTALRKSAQELIDAAQRFVDDRRPAP